MDTDPKGRKRWGAAGPVHDRARPSLYRTPIRMTGRVTQGAGAGLRRSGTPEARTQLEELRTGERVAEPEPGTRTLRQDPAASRKAVRE